MPFQDKIFQACNAFHHSAIKFAKDERSEVDIIVPGNVENEIDEPSRGVVYVEPNFESEFEEAQRYQEFQNKEDWFRVAKAGKPVAWNELDGSVANHNDDISNLDQEKVERVETSILRDKVEYPIVGRWPSGQLELIAGNTRVAMLKHLGHDPIVWLIDVPTRKKEASLFFRKLAESLEVSGEDGNFLDVLRIIEKRKSLSEAEKQEKIKKLIAKKISEENDPEFIMELLDSDYFDDVKFGDRKYTLALSLAMNYAKNPESKPSSIFYLIGKHFMQESDRKRMLVRQFILSHPNNVSDETKEILLNQAHGLDSKTIQISQRKKEESISEEAS